MSSVKYHLLLKVVLSEKLLNYLHHFLVSAGKTGASQANFDLSFVLVHE